MLSFALIGAAGYIAPRHLQAIRDTGHRLVAAMDPCDSVGVLDRYFPDAEFFTREEDLRSFLSGSAGTGRPVDYLVVCSPNHLHPAHIRLGLETGCDVICEKPAALHSHEIAALQGLEGQTGRRVYTLMQLRLHPSIQALEERIQKANPEHRYQVELEYITPRGRWYFRSWKGDPARSGGILVNIGIHLFDLLAWLFGPVIVSKLEINNTTEATGTLQLARADVNWRLSIDPQHLPVSAREKGDHAFRRMLVDGQPVDFSVVGNDLHTAMYREILAGRGFGLGEAGKGLELVERLRS